MAYGVKYRFEFYSKINNILNRIDILEDAFVGSVTILNEMGADPITIKWAGAEYEKDQPIIASEATLQFIQTDTFDIDSFFSDTDLKYKVNHYLDTRLNWTGFIQTNDLLQPYQDAPNYFSVHAIDGLAFLKTIDLVDDTGQGIYGQYNIMYFCKMALAQTGHELNINNWINIFPYDSYGSGSVFSRQFNASVDPFNLAYIYGQTFMSGKYKWENCYNVLTKIMKTFRARLFQYDGEWQFVRTEDYIYYNDVLTGSKWTYADTFPVSSTWEKDFSEEITKDGLIIQVERSVSEGRKRGVKSTKLIHSYQQWPQLIQNDRLKDGTFNAPLSGAGYSTYSLDDWNRFRVTAGPTVTPDTGDCYIRAEFTGQVETDRYMIIFYNATGTDKARSTYFPVSADNRLTFSFRTRESTSAVGSGNQAVYLYIRESTTSNNVYWLGKDGKWYSGTYNLSTHAMTNSHLLGYTWASTEDRRNWKDFTVTAESFPIGGIIFVEFWSDGMVQTGGNHVRFADIQIDLGEYVYKTATAAGQKDQLTQSATIIDDIEDDMPLCNTPFPTDQGAIFSGTDLPLSVYWCHHQVDEQIPFMRIVNYGLFRSHYRAYKSLDGIFNGIRWNDGGSLLPIGMINTFQLDGTATRYLPTTLDIDYKKELVNMQLIELFTKDGTDDTKIADTTSFLYVDVEDRLPIPIYPDRMTMRERLGYLLGHGIWGIFNFKKLLKK